MPGYTRGVLRDNLVYVAVNSDLYYGFQTKDFAALTGLTTAEMTTQLGHTEGAAVPSTSWRIIGARAPKPARVKMVLNANPSSASIQESASTFCAYNKLTTAMDNGWKLIKQAKPVTLTSNSRTITVAAETSSGLLVCEPKNAADVAAYKDILGLQTPDQLESHERKICVMYSSMPKATRVTKKLETGKSITMPCSYDSLDDAFTDGWTLLRGEFDINKANVAPAPAP